jgi:hypothetical protein
VLVRELYPLLCWMFLHSHGQRDKERGVMTLPGAVKTFLSSRAGWGQRGRWDKEKEKEKH